MMKKQRKAQAASGVKLKPEYKGPAPKPNRFNIKCVSDCGFSYVLTL